jgi:hypothetical protein
MHQSLEGPLQTLCKFKYLKNLTVKVCKIWCNDVYMSILQCDIFWWKLIDRNFFNPIFKKMKFQIWWVYADRKSKMAATTGHSINTGPYEENTEMYFSLKLLH